LSDVAAGAAVIHDWNALHMVVDGAVRPMEDLVIGGTMATELDLTEGEEEEKAFNHMVVVGAEYQLTDDMNIRGGYKKISADWKPAYIADKDNYNDRGQNWVHAENRRDSGFYAGISTEQAGIKLAADYDQMFDEAKLSAATDVEGYKVSVQTALAVDFEEGIRTNSTTFAVDKDYAIMKGLDVHANYTGKWNRENGLSHTIGADAKVGLIPAVDGLKLNSKVTISDLETIGYAVGAEFKAPNGIQLGIEHVGGNFADSNVKTGTTAKAGIAVNF